MRKKAFLLLPTILLLLISYTTTMSQGLLGGGNGESDRIEGKFKFIPLPYIDYDRSYGGTIGFIPIAMYNPSVKDTISPSSVGGLLAMYSENKSWFTMGFGMNYLKEDNWRLLYAFGLGDDNFQFYLNNPINRWIPYTTNAEFFFVDVKKRVYSDLFLGLNYIYTGVITNTDYFKEQNALHGLGFEAAFDRRSNVSYPRSGYLVNAYYLTYPSFFGNNIQSNQLVIDYNHYFSVRNKKDVVALRWYSGIGIGDVEFNQQFIVGDSDIRGYSQGEFRGNYLLALQAEYRWNFHERLGLVGFAGVATVYESVNPSQDGSLLPGIGAGFRYTYMKETHSNIGFDIAKGRNDWSFNLRFSEAF